MAIVAGLFGDPDRLTRAVDGLFRTGFVRDQVSVITGPTSAGDVAWQAVRDAGRAEGGVVDLPLDLDGQASGGPAGGERVVFEQRVARGAMVLRVDAPDAGAAGRAARVLRDAGAERISPGA
jgi:hypothetical protein